MKVDGGAYRAFLLFIILCCQLRNSHGKVVQLSHITNKAKAVDFKCLERKPSVKRPHFGKIMRVRGGSDAATSGVNSNEAAAPVENCAILVSTSVGSVFLDKKKRLTISRNSTIAELKSLIEKKFPGCPPTGLQRLFLGARALSDEELVGNITITTPTPILLDMLSGTSVYNKTLSISQALEAHAALIVQQSYLGAKMMASYNDVPEKEANETTSAPVHLESGLYRDMFDSVNRTLYETYSEDIAEALEREREPETHTDDTAAWRGKRKETTPLTAALAKEFDLNMRGIRSFLYYSVLLGIFAFYGTTSVAATQFLLLLVPFLWLSKLRQLRLLHKIIQYLVLPVIPHIEFLMPLLPAPQQVIAIESANWFTGKDQSRPILPQPKPLGPGPILPQSKQNKWLDDVISTIMLALQKLLGSGDVEVEVVLEGESGDVDEMDRSNEDDLEADSVQVEGSDEIDEEEDDLQADSEEEENEGNAEEEEGEEGNAEEEAEEGNEEEEGEEGNEEEEGEEGNAEEEAEEGNAEEEAEEGNEEEEGEEGNEEEEGEEGNAEEGDDESIDNDDEEDSVESEDGDEDLEVEVEVEVDEDFRED